MMTFNLFLNYLPNFLLMLAVFTVGVASPGPATLMIANVAMSQGRTAAVAISLGIITGSTFWAGFAALGFAAALKASATLFSIMKLAGGCYLLFLACKSLSSALKSPKTAVGTKIVKKNLSKQFQFGLLLHLTNPKAPLVWLATLSIAIDAAAPASVLMFAVLLCTIVAVIVFVGYAYLFSTQVASRVYLSFRRPFEVVLGFLFGAAAIKILTLKTY